MSGPTPDLPREAAGGGPRPEEGVVEGASLKLGPLRRPVDPLSPELAPSTPRFAAGGPPPAIAGAMGEVKRDAGARP